jgi:acyl dehydratase
MFHLQQVADLAGQALADAGLTLQDIDGLVVPGVQFHEAGMFVPAMVGEYLGVRLDFAETIDLGGASSVGAVWRAAAAIELGMCNTVLCVIPARMAPLGGNDDHAAEVMKASRFGGHSTRFGAPEAEMDLPYGHMAQNTGYAMIAQRYAALSGDDDWIHPDVERSRSQSPFSTTIAQGALVLVLTSQLKMPLAFEVTDYNNMVNYGSDRLRFPTPVLAGCRIHGRARVKAVAQVKNNVQLTLELNIHIVGNERPSVINDLVILCM